MNTLLSFAQTSYEYTTYSTTSDVDEATLAAVGAGIFIFSLIIAVIAYVVGALLIGRIFKKAGVESWIAWVPFYNNYKLLEIGGQAGFWAILAVIPVVNFVSAIFMYISMYNIGLKLGKEGIFILWAIFFPIVWLIWLAFDKSTWNNALGAPSVAAEHNRPAGPQAPVATPAL